MPLRSVAVAGGIEGLHGLFHIRDAAALVTDHNGQKPPVAVFRAQCSTMPVLPAPVAVHDGIRHRLAYRGFDIRHLRQRGIELHGKGRDGHPRERLVLRQRGKGKFHSVLHHSRPPL